MNISARMITLSEMPILKTLTKEQIEKIAENAIFQKVAKNNIIYDTGQKIEYVYLIEKGSIKLGMLASCGKTLTKDLVYDLQIFGENIFTSGTTTREFAEAMIETKLFKIPVEVFKNIVFQNNAFASEIMVIIVAKLQNMEERLKNFVFKKAKERIVDFIYRTGLRKGIKIGINECLIDHGMSHKEIAYLTDTSRQTVARILNELKKENFIHYSSRKSSKILIRDMQVMKEYRLAG